MITARFIGTLTARSPIYITRPEQGDVPLTMNVVRNQTVVRVHVIPGETIKGLLRQTAYSLCVDAATRDGELKVSLALFYRQTAGGIGLTSEKLAIGEDATIRQREPILSLFGAAQPRLTGRLAVHHAIAQPALGLDGSEGTGLPPGTRRDAVIASPALSDVLGQEDRQLWARQGALVSELSDANRHVEDTKRILGRARRTQGASIKELEQALAEAERNVAKIKAKPEFQHAVQRPIPQKQAAPAGTVYDHGFEVTGASPGELGLLLATLQVWSMKPRIGGGTTTGYGHVLGDYMIQCLVGDGPPREWRWKPAGKVTIGGDGAAIESEAPEITSAMAAWAELERSLRTRTAIFGS